MQNLESKKNFLRKEYIPLLRQLDANTERRCGKMNVHQMIEHMADYFRIGCGKDPQELVTPAEHVEKYQAFLTSEKPFKENTPNSLMPDTPAPTRHADILDAINELSDEVGDFFLIFENDPGKKVVNPFFGELNYDMSVQLIHKHALHHLKQFGVEVGVPAS
jgi:hypothetical protein